MRFKRTVPCFALAVSLLSFGLAACGSGGGSAAVAASSAASSSISAARCAENKAAGKITYLSGYYYQASASILEYVAASKLGYFSDLCLNVALVPGNGDTAQLSKLLASGQADIAGLAEQDLIQARANGVDVEAMLVKSGVTFSSLHVVKEGYDPTVLPRHAGGIEGLTGFVSNEPNQLKEAGYKVTVWQPVKYGIPSSLGAMAVNPAFALAHPTAVEDLLRAALHAYAYCTSSPANVAQCVGYAAALSGGTTYNTKLNTAIWNTETSVVAANPTPGEPLGGISPPNVAAVTAMLHQFSLVPASVTAPVAEGWFDDAYIKAIYKGDTLIWPAP